MNDPLNLHDDIVAKALQLWRSQVEATQRKRLKKAGRPQVRSPFTIRNLPAVDRPRERMLRFGERALSQQELLACLLGRGVAGESVLVTAQRLLSGFGSLQGIAEASIEQLASVKGMGPAKAVQIKAACELSRRARLQPQEPGAEIRSAQEAIQVAANHLSGRQKEHFVLLLLDARHRVSKIAEISVGSLDMSVVHPRETFKEAIRSSAAAIILAHNHPSGDPTPSPEDLELTHRLIEGGELLGIPVLDHIIVGAPESMSLKEEGLWPEEEGEEPDEDA
ncbi:MAG: DNA repair protein RadC [Candidatus Omnitrophica bacterium]|nr:DNA repair protein RadC [Candidatus Omnitrophota bacterium]